MAKYKIKDKKHPKAQAKARATAQKPAKEKFTIDKPFLWAIGVCVVTSIVFFPMLSNGFTNWDDQFYITENLLLRGPDWAGIFSKAVVSNYHPLTVASLALNYQFSELSPFSYHLVNWIFHILNTGLVFYLIYRLSNSHRWVSAITALWFGIHPMHVESVAWASERKDVLYAFFFLLSLIFYLRFARKSGWRNYTAALILFGFSLLSKPAAVTLPVILLLVDWYQGRSLKNKKVWLEKLPFFALALTFGVMTLQIQAEKAIAQPDFYPIWQRIVFAFYGFGEYIKRLFWPMPLSAIHPFPASATVPASFYPALLITIVTVALAWYFRRKKYVVFGLVFYAFNIALVLQLLAFGNSIISERYTYVPYIGLVFVLMMAWAHCGLTARTKNLMLGLILAAILGLAILSIKQVRVWKDSMSLWTNAIKAYPDSYLALSNRGNYLVTQLQNYDEGLKDFTIALQTKPDHLKSLENRTIIYLHKQNFEAAFADADLLVRYHPNSSKGYLLRAFSADKLNKTDQAISDYAKCIELDPQNAEPFVNRGIIYFNTKQDYRAAKADFDAALHINPNQGNVLLNRARCWTIFRNKAEAMKDINAAKQLGVQIPEDVIYSAQSIQ